jgi:ABC-type oligopeptide transport system substrate-binding subunit
MFIRAKIAIAAALLLSAAVTASAATKSGRNAARHGSSPQGQVAVPRNPPALDPDSPAAAGGGSLGFNRNQTDDW